jgi:hypothetical protein
MLELIWYVNMRYPDNFRTYCFTERVARNDNIKMDLAEIGYESTNFTEAGHDNK